MTKRSHKTQKTQTKLQELVTVTFAEDSKQARDYETLLKVNDIPAIIKEQNQDGKLTDAKGIAVMVPEDFLDEAHVVIESQNTYDDFYDIALEDEDNGDFNSDLLSDEF